MTQNNKEKVSADTQKRAKPQLKPGEIESRYQEHLRRVAGPAKVGGN